MSAHAVLSASGSHRWLNCPGSRKAEEGFTSESSVFAREGTAAHHLGETCLKKGNDAYDYVGEYIYAGDKDEDNTILFQADIDSDRYVLGETLFEITADFADYVQMYVDLVRGTASSENGSTTVEVKVDFSRWVPGGFGTVDALVIAANKIFVIDLKFGKGVKVEAVENSQLMLYALGAISDLEDLLTGDETVTTMICQPRLDWIDSYETKVSDLLEWADTVVKPAAELAMTDDAPLMPGESQCRFCAANAVCPALIEKTEETASFGFEIEGEPPAPETVDKLRVNNSRSFTDFDNAELAKLLEESRLMQVWLNAALKQIGALEDHAKTRMEEGETIPGWKMVAGRGSRTWADETAAEKALRRKLGAKAAYAPTKILSPAQAEKKLGKNSHIIQKYVAYNSGSPTIAPESDKRSAIVVDHSEGF